MDKVFCGECKSFHPYKTGFNGECIYVDKEWCSSEKNLIDTYANPKSKYLYLPSQKNINNDCGWFVKKSKIKPTPIPFPEMRIWTKECWSWFHKFKEIKNTGKWSYQICSKCGKRKIGVSVNR